MLNISYERESRRAVLTWELAHREADWVKLLRRVFLDHSEDLVEHSTTMVSLPWWTFLSARSQVKEVLSGYKVGIKADDAALVLLRDASANETSYSQAATAVPEPSERILKRLSEKKFSRTLTKEQLRNVSRIAGL